MKYQIRKSTIFLHDIHIHAFHGVFSQERTVGNDFCIQIRLGCDLTKAGLSDDLKDTVSYADVYQIIKEEMNIPSALLEHVSRRIIDHLFLSLPQVETIELSIAKRNPPMGGDLKEAGVEMTCSRQDNAE